MSNDILSVPLPFDSKRLEITVGQGLGRCYLNYGALPNIESRFLSGFCHTHSFSPADGPERAKDVGISLRA